MIWSQPAVQGSASSARCRLSRAWYKVQAAGGDPKTVDAQVEALVAEKAQCEADAQSLMLPGLKAAGDVSLRTTRENDEVLGSVLDYLRWLGVEDEWGNTWKNWLGEEFRTVLNSTTSNATGEILFVDLGVVSQMPPLPIFLMVDPAGIKPVNHEWLRRGRGVFNGVPIHVAQDVPPVCGEAMLQQKR